eukprot:301132-Rhodomonas_salina.1
MQPHARSAPKKQQDRGCKQHTCVRQTGSWRLTFVTDGYINSPASTYMEHPHRQMKSSTSSPEWMNGRVNTAGGADESQRGASEVTHKQAHPLDHFAARVRLQIAGFGLTEARQGQSMHDA